MSRDYTAKSLHHHVYWILPMEFNKLPHGIVYIAKRILCETGYAINCHCCCLSELFVCHVFICMCMSFLNRNGLGAMCIYSIIGQCDMDMACNYVLSFMWFVCGFKANKMYTCQDKR